MRRKPGIVWETPLTVCFVPELRSSQRELYSGGRVGQEVHAASSIRDRRITFDRGLLSNPAEFRRIVTHELFHFAWNRLGNPSRRDWEGLLGREFAAGARGELGWSAEWRKREIKAKDRHGRSRRWRDYVCESFCDTAAWLFTGAPAHAEATLGRRRAGRRAEWFVKLFHTRGVSI